MLIPINPEKISNTPTIMTPVNPADPGSPTGPTLENKAHSENSIEETGKSPHSDPTPERRYDGDYAYTLEEFCQFYGKFSGTQMWSRARRAEF